MFGGFAVPFDCLDVVLFNAHAIKIAIAKTGLRLGKPLLSAFGKPFYGFWIILFIKIKISSQLIILAPESTCSDNCDPINHAKISLPQKFLHIPTFTNVNVNVFPPPVSLF